MQNWFAMETEAEFRRQEWAREADRDRTSAQVCAEPSRPRDYQLPRLSHSALKRLIAPRLSPAMPLAASRREAPC